MENSVDIPVQPVATDFHAYSTHKAKSIEITLHRSTCLGDSGTRDLYYTSLLLSPF